MKLYWVDAFTDNLFSGNPAAVVPLEKWLDDTTMKHIAFENGISETAFFVRTGDARFSLRWFTPAVEVNLCGHATLASAFVIFNYLEQSGDVITFDTRSGPLTVVKKSDALELNFPASKPEPILTTDVPQAMMDCVNIKPLEVLKSPSNPYYIFVYLTQSDVVALQPDMILLKSIEHGRLFVTAPGDDCDCASRVFAPAAGVPEDPVTGSAHCALVPYWSARLHKTSLHARQVSARGGELFCEIAADRVKMAGKARLYMIGDIMI